MSASGRWARRALPVLSIGAVLAGAAAGPALAQGIVSAPVARLDVVEHAITDTEIPVAAGGKDEKGDPLTFTNPIYNAADTKQIGHDEGFCLRLTVKPGSWECLWTTFVHGGSIMVQGPFYDHHSSTLAITGGTGQYSDVTGSMFLQAIDGGKKYHFDFELG